MTIGLPGEILGKTYEEAVSSFIKARGYFVENRLILDHKGKELLELDTVATPSNESFIYRILIDAKSGKNTGFSDIFKIYGWKEYLKIPTGCIIRKVIPEDRDFAALDAHKDDLKMSWVIFDIVDHQINTEMDDSIPVIIPKGNDLYLTVFVSAWWQCIAERIVKKSFDDFCKSNHDNPLIEKVKKYEKACLLSFFEKDPIKRVVDLYSAFKNDPNIGKQAIDYEVKRSGLSERSVQDKIFDTSELLWIQYICLLEHRARTLIIKCAVDICFTTPCIEDRWGYLNYQHSINLTPESFQYGLKKMRKIEYKEKVPYFFQVFIEIFGGYYIVNTEDDKDIRMICEVAGINYENFATCLGLFDDFFPTSGTWFLSSRNMKRFKFIPLCLRGVGSFVRHNYLCTKYEELDSDIAWLMWKYHNSFIDLLAKDKTLIVNE